MGGILSLAIHFLLTISLVLTHEACIILVTCNPIYCEHNNNINIYYTHPHFLKNQRLHLMTKHDVILVNAFWNLINKSLQGKL
jgi:hypothetical protein